MERSARTSIADLMQEMPVVPMQEIPVVPAPPPAPFVVQTATGQITGAPTEVYQGALAQRRELRNQQDRLQDQRQELRNELQNEQNLSPADRAGVEARIKDIDVRISAIDQQIAKADAAVAQAAALPGATEQPRQERNGPPDEILAVPIVFTIFVLMPIAIAYARRIWRKGATVVAPIPKDITDRLEAMGQAVESIAIEVERIGEGQRFLTRVMSDKGKRLGAGAAEPIPVPQVHGEQVAVPRYER